MKRNYMFAAALVTTLWACNSDDENNHQDKRLSIGKADAFGSCAGFCGSQSDGNCWCDAQCELYGDCCSDYVSLCKEETSNNETLCETTGGVWEANACACEQDGASLGYQFFPQYGGCIPNPKELCENTGGAMEDTGCACAQDGASYHYEFFPADGGCKMPGNADLIEDATSLALPAIISKYFDETNGTYIVSRPGVADVIELYDSKAALQGDFGSYLGNATSVCEAISMETLPEHDGDHFAKEGCFLQYADLYDRLSSLMQLLKDTELAEYTDVQIAGMQSYEQNIIYLFVNTQDAYVLGFRRVAGEWKLAFIDFSAYDFSA